MTNEKVTLRDVYAVSNRLEDKLDNALDKMDGRISSLEQANARSRGFAAAIGAVTGAGITLLGSFIQAGILHK